MDGSEGERRRGGKEGEEERIEGEGEREGKWMRIFMQVGSGGEVSKGK